MDKRFKNTVFLLFALVLIAVFLMTMKSGNRRHSAFVKKEYHGVITDIKWPQYRRGCPDILINDKWIELTYEEEFLFKEIRLGDSIVKHISSDTVIIFRRDSLNNQTVNEFYE